MPPTSPVVGLRSFLIRQQLSKTSSRRQAHSFQVIVARHAPRPGLTPDAGQLSAAEMTRESWRHRPWPGQMPGRSKPPFVKSLKLEIPPAAGAGADGHGLVVQEFVNPGLDALLAESGNPDPSE